VRDTDGVGPELLDRDHGSGLQLLNVSLPDAGRRGVRREWHDGARSWNAPGGLEVAAAQTCRERCGSDVLHILHFCDEDRYCPDALGEDLGERRGSQGSIGLPYRKKVLDPCSGGDQHRLSRTQRCRESLGRKHRQGTAKLLTRCRIEIPNHRLTGPFRTDGDGTDPIQILADVR
jgi:hypothetical protein